MKLKSKFDWGVGAETLEKPKSDLLRSHDELRAALRVAGKEIRKLNFGRDTVLKLLRRVLREAREAERVEQNT